MSLATNLATAFTRVATEFKNVKATIGDITGLTTTSKTSVVSAINELKQDVNDAASTGGATNLDQLTDVAISSPADGDLISRTAGTFTNVPGSSLFDIAGAAAAAQAASQPLDPDLTALAALVTTAYGRGFLTLASAADLMALLSAASTTVQGIVELATTAEATTGTDSTRAVTPAGLKAATDALRTSILGAGVPAALDTLDELAAALGDDANFAASVTTSLANKQPLDADLMSISALASAADKMLYATGSQTWALATLTSFARTLLAGTSKSAMQTTLGIVDTASIGDPATDFVAAFEAGLV